MIWKAILLNNVGIWQADWPVKLECLLSLNWRAPHIFSFYFLLYLGVFLGMWHCVKFEVMLWTEAKLIETNHILRPKLAPCFVRTTSGSPIKIVCGQGIWFCYCSLTASLQLFSWTIFNKSFVRASSWNQLQEGGSHFPLVWD